MSLNLSSANQGHLQTIWLKKVQFTYLLVAYRLLLDKYTKLSKAMNRLVKYLGLLLIGIGIITDLVDQSAGSEIPLLVGLFILFISREKREDERAILLKSSSTSIALIIGYGFKLISSNFYAHQLISFQLTDINYFLILVFALALSIYYLRLYLSWK
ncbi:hypothetical protein GCM10028803_10400 [Larkinella knui]